MQISKSILQLFLSILLVAVFSTVYAGEVTVFGPKQYIRTTGAPNIYIGTFSANPGEAWIVIRNGEAEASKKNTRVRSGVVRLNGVELFSHDDFKQQTYLLENGVILQENNSLQIELASRPTTFITIEIIRADDSILPGGTLTADPATLTVGSSSTLAWATTHTTSCTIAPDIGSVDLSGSMTITPTQTTEYTLTMVGPGGTSTNRATITVIAATPPPVVSLSTNDDVITPGASTTLSWNSEYADTLTIEPGLGTVALTGSIMISPEATTTYIATANGSGGTSSAQVVVTVMYPEPIAALSAAPSAITSGESSTLTWSTQYAQTCTIEPNIGIVPCTGELTVTPAEETTYILTAGGQGGTTTAQVNVTVMTTADLLSLAVTSPSEGDSISRPDVMVTGTIHHRDGLETGVMVNGVTALVYDDQFVANHVPLIDGENTITVKAVDVNGEYVEKALAVTVESFIRYVELQTDIESGLVPFETTLKLNTNFTSPAQPEFSFVGPGEIEFIPGVEPATWTVSITEPGIYVFFVELEDENGLSYSDQTSVQAYDRNTLDALLQVKWGEMKQSLFLNQIDNAVAFFLEGSQAIYKNQFEFIANAGVLSQVVNNMGAFRLVKHDGYGIIYDLRTIKNGEEYSFQVLFVQDTDGIWRIKNY